MAQSQSYWASISADIEAHLERAVQIRPPHSVFEPLHHLTFAAKRTAAPALCVAACELVGGRRDQAMAAASALHLIHAAFYTHENLPLTDGPNPKPQIHHAYGPNVELLTADGMVPLAFELLARSDDDPTGEKAGRILRVMVEIGRAVGSQGAIDGRYREFLCAQSDGKEMGQVGWVDYVCEKKEGGLHACGAACGAILGGGNEEEIERLRKFGLNVGMIQGRVKGVSRNGVEMLKDMALKELEHFDSNKVEEISGLVEAKVWKKVQNK
ncbi:hypothetical protein RJ641_000392 [Dillenia turbinata]|uniref:Uncharacterized protein n=1 Tax=Dillenia turbinata TaxID=194707 RepID=A0AAN8ZMB5_9MAGN